MTHDYGLETKFCRTAQAVSVTEGRVIEGYASLYGWRIMAAISLRAGAYAKSLAALKARGGSVKMLWQHDAAQPIGVWDEIHEDERGLYVKGRLLLEVERAREAAADRGGGD